MKNIISVIDGKYTLGKRLAVFINLKRDPLTFGLRITVKG